MTQMNRYVGDNVTKEQHEERVMALILELGLLKCCDSLIGNARVRGISGEYYNGIRVSLLLLTCASPFRRRT